jgi:hypothetical protein
MVCHCEFDLTYEQTDCRSCRLLAVIRLLTAGGDFDGTAELVNGTIDPVRTEQQLIGIHLPAQGVTQIAIAGQNLVRVFRLRCWYRADSSSTVRPQVMFAPETLLVKLQQALSH